MRNRPLCTICLVLFAIMCISIRTGGDKFLKELKASPMELMVPEKSEIRAVGQVYQKEIREDHQILYLKNNSIHYQQRSLNESRIIVYDETKENIKIGNKVELRGELTFYENARNPGNFDQKLYYQRQNIHGFIWASQIRRKGNEISKVRNALYEFRQRWKLVLIETLGEKDGGILTAVLLGEKAGVEEEIKTLYQVNGIGHILAISGLHLSFIGMGIYQMFRKKCGSYTVGGVAGITFLMVYIVMIGMTVSAFRALLMFLFRVGADMTGRHYDSLTALAVSAVMVILWRPLYIYDGGFWLSFGAVLAVILVLPRFKELPIQGFWASVSINLVIFPLLLYYFFEFPFYSIVLNLLIIPLMSVLLFLGIVGSALTCIVPFGGSVLRLCRMILWMYEKSCMLVMHLPGARMVTGKPEFWRVIFYYVCLAIVLLWLHYDSHRKEINGRKGRCVSGSHRKQLLMLGIVCLGVFALTVKLPNRNKVEVTVLDVGQGDCIFIRGPSGGT